MLTVDSSPGSVDSQNGGRLQCELWAPSRSMRLLWGAEYVLATKSPHMFGGGIWCHKKRAGSGKMSALACEFSRMLMLELLSSFPQF